MKIDVGFVWAFAVLASAALVQVPVVLGKEELCSAGNGRGNVCAGVSARMLSGACTPLFFVCDDGDAGTVSSCVTNTATCSHQVPTESDEPKCFTECAPDCENKACGEDGCGGFCGACATGQGCSNYECVTGQSDGSCEAPLNLGNTDTTAAPIIETDDRVTIITVGDTTQALHFETPSCNTLTASPELIFSFVVPEGKTYGYDMQLSGYDTVIQLMKDKCSSEGNPGLFVEEHILNCNDDGTPPGGLGSHIFGSITGGTYYIMIDGYSTTDAGPFELTTTFINGCTPLCDGSFCGSDACGGTCGTCAEGNVCNAVDKRCYTENCVPECASRACGEDGCGGSCGTCSGDNDVALFCLGVSITTEDGSIPPSSCESFPVCNHFNPTCTGCSDTQICASDCLCYDSLEDLADLVVIEEDMLNEMYLQDVIFPESSCALIEGCVNAPGLRRLMRFTSTIMNQGRSDLSFPEPKDRPDLFEFGNCHQHYHFREFATYTLFEEDGETFVYGGAKYAYCMEDTVRAFDGANVGCDRVYDCGSQGIQSGWKDSYGWSLDCSWLDITDLAPGTYVLVIETNPARVFPEVSFDNNRQGVVVTIPAVEGVVDVAMKLETARFSIKDGSTSAAPETFPIHALIMAVAVLGTLTL